MADQDELSTHFETLGLPVEARAWLLDLWNVIQVFDDAMDGDRAASADVSRAVWAIFASMPLNDFYCRNAGILQPILALQVLKWEAANAVERAGGACEVSFVWRAGFYEVVLMACHICGIKAGPECLVMYGETYAEYMEDQLCQVH